MGPAQRDGRLRKVHGLVRSRELQPRLRSRSPPRPFTLPRPSRPVRVDGHVKFTETFGHVHNGRAQFTDGHVGADVLDLAWLDRSWQAPARLRHHLRLHHRSTTLRRKLPHPRSSRQAYWAYLAPFEPPTSAGRPSSGWHVARLALQSCDTVRMYGFSMEADDFHYFDSLVQEKVTPPQRDPRFGHTHKFAREHEVFANWSRHMPERFELHQ